MSTSATITFSDDTVKASVYSHGDGYPSGIYEALIKAKKLAWDLPRFEADEFAAAFIAANKIQGGGFRVIPNPKKYGVAYHYDVTLKGGELFVTCKKSDFADDDKLKKHATGALPAMLSWAD